MIGRIEVRIRPVALNGNIYYHKSLVLVRSDGTVQSVIEAGAGFDFPPTAEVQLDYDGPRTYDPGLDDITSGDQQATVVDGNTLNDYNQTHRTDFDTLEELFNEFANRGQQIDDADINYWPNPNPNDPMDGNSNSFVDNILASLGITPPTFPGYNVPGEGDVINISDALTRIVAHYLQIIKDAIADATWIYSPLVLDLDGDGIELVSLANSNAFFDLDGDGFAEKTGWVAGGDGLLALDGNGNGRIDGITELFGSNNAPDGFAALAALDSNADGKIDAGDSQFANLRIWVDGDGDGWTDNGELKTLAEAGVAAINLNAAATGTWNQDNWVSHVSTFTRAAGGTGQVADVWFKLDQVNSRYVSDYQLNPQALSLPYLRGYGTVASLHVAMSLDATLLSMVRDFAVTQPVNWSGLDSQIEAIVYRWAGVVGVAPGSRGEFMDARRLEALENFMGQDFVNIYTGANPPIWAADRLEQAWCILANEIKTRLLVQGPLALKFPDLDLNVATDSFSGGNILDAVGAIRGLAPVGQPAANLVQFWSTFVPVLHVLQTYLPADPAYISALTSAITASGLDAVTAARMAESGRFLIGGNLADALTGLNDTNEFMWGGAGADTLEGRTGSDILDGGAGSDVLRGDGGNDTLDGGAENDFLYGGEGDDVYVFGRGYGSEWIADADGANDKILMRADVAPADVILSRAGPSFNEFVVSISGTADKITVGDNFVYPWQLVEEIHFADGTVWNQATIRTRLLTPTMGNDLLIGFATNDIMSGLAGDDFIQGREGNDTLDGGAGADWLYGGAGDDLFVFGRGYGSDRFIEADGAGDAILMKADVAPGDVTLSRSNLDLIVKIAGTADQITVVDNFSYGWLRLEEIRFADGTIWTPAIIEAMLRIGTAGNDTITGTAFNDLLTGLGGDDVISGLAGHDSLLGGDGNDTLDGGAGNDTLDGGAGFDNLLGGVGTDTYVFDLGYGQDRIVDFDTTLGVIDTVTFGANISPTNLQVSRPSQGNVNDLVVKIIGATDQLTIGEHFNGAGGNRIEEFRFTDGTVWTAATVNSMLQTGTAGNDTITGTAFNDALNGAGGNDFIFGLAGHDVLLGGDGNDQLEGGMGRDTLTGGAGDDLFVYRSVSDSSFNVRDILTDFTAGGTVDEINLAQFGFTGAAIRNIKETSVSAFASADTLNFFDAGSADRAVAVEYSGGAARVYVDANLDGNFSFASDLVLELNAIAANALAASDFKFA